MIIDELALVVCVCQQYSYLLSSQLETQRLFFEEKMALIEKDLTEQVRCGYIEVDLFNVATSHLLTPDSDLKTYFPAP